MNRAWIDGGGAVEVAAMGPRIRHALRAFDLRLRGGCDHRDREQFATVGDLRTACADCASASGTFEQLSRGGGVCDVCGAGLDPDPGRRLWYVHAAASGAFVGVRVCGHCARTELGAVSPNDEMEDDDDD